MGSAAPGISMGSRKVPLPAGRTVVALAALCLFYLGVRQMSAAVDAAGARANLADAHAQIQDLHARYVAQVRQDVADCPCRTGSGNKSPRGNAWLESGEGDDWLSSVGGQSGAARRRVGTAAQLKTLDGLLLRDAETQHYLSQAQRAAQHAAERCANVTAGARLDTERLRDELQAGKQQTGAGLVVRFDGAVTVAASLLLIGTLDANRQLKEELEAAEKVGDMAMQRNARLQQDRARLERELAEARHDSRGGVRQRAGPQEGESEEAGDVTAAAGEASVRLLHAEIDLLKAQLAASGGTAEELHTVSLRDASMEAANGDTAGGGDKDCPPCQCDCTDIVRKLEEGNGATGGGEPAVAAATRRCRAVLMPAPSLPCCGGGTCRASAEDMEVYGAYTPGALCPDDWLFVQTLVFDRGCGSLPRRRCFAPVPERVADPLPQPLAFFSPVKSESNSSGAACLGGPQAALRNGNVRWNHHRCKSYDCLRRRAGGDCRNCFDLGKEAKRWEMSYYGTFVMREIVAMMNGTLRIGLDAGGGTGTFAAKMARPAPLPAHCQSLAVMYNVTIVTTAMNIETGEGEYGGIPFMETIAQRGLIPLHLPHSARLPFFDNTLDLVHSTNSIIRPSFDDFDELLYEWNRVLRPGGIIWMELFTATVVQMKEYIIRIENKKYRQLLWNLQDKPFKAGREPQQYLNFVIQKPLSRQ
eukprot:SM000087S23359  [mRNA]  locus=s87:284717:287639:- [translate_table: standard]